MQYETVIGISTLHLIAMTSSTAKNRGEFTYPKSFVVSSYWVKRQWPLHLSMNNYVKQRQGIMQLTFWRIFSCVMSADRWTECSCIHWHVWRFRSRLGCCQRGIRRIQKRDIACAEVFWWQFQTEHRKFLLHLWLLFTSSLKRSNIQFTKWSTHFCTWSEQIFL